MSNIQMDLNEIKQGAPFAAVSYIFVLWILVFILIRDNEFARFHARQGIVISIGNFACFAFSFIPALGILFVFLQMVLVCASIYGIYLALTGKMQPIPLVGDIAKKMVV